MEAGREKSKSRDKACVCSECLGFNFDACAQKSKETAVVRRNSADEPVDDESDELEEVDGIPAPVVGDYVAAALYKDEWYPGQIIAVDDERVCQYSIKCMEAIGTGDTGHGASIRSRGDDIIDVGIHQVLARLDPPVPLSSRYGVVKTDYGQRGHLTLRIE